MIFSGTTVVPRSAALSHTGFATDAFQRHFLNFNYVLSLNPSEQLLRRVKDRANKPKLFLKATAPDKISRNLAGFSYCILCIHNKFPLPVSNTLPLIFYNFSVNMVYTSNKNDNWNMENCWKLEIMK